MNNIIGNTPYRNIQNKKYIDSTAEYIGKLADFLEKEQIPYSGRISEYRSTITVSGEENFKRASEILDRIMSEKPRRFIGNTQYKYIRDKRIIPMDADIVDKIAARLDSEHIMYSGVVEGEKGRITVSGSEIEALVKGYIEQERNGYTKGSFEISLTSDAFDEVYYLSDKSGNAYYDADGVVPTFNHFDDAAEYAKAHNISISTDDAQINQWREIERADKIRHDNAELVTSFPRMGNDYPDHFTYNSDGNSFEWTYYNPDGNFGEGEFVRKTIYEQDILDAYNAKINAADETTGRNEFIYSLFSSCEEYIISSDTEAFTSAAKDYINKPENTLEFYGIAENSSNIIDVDRLISALEEKSSAVRSSEEEKANIIHNSFEVIINAHDFSKEAIKFLRRAERFMVKDNIFMVDENIINQKFHIIYGDVSRATKRLFGVKFKDVLDELNLVIKQNSQLSVKKPDVRNDFEEYYDKNSPVGNIVHDDNLSLSEKLYNIAKQELEEYESSLDTAEKAKAAAYELTVKRDILSYIQYDLSSDIADSDVQSAVENLIKTGSPLSVYYNEWLKNEYDNRMEAVRMTAEDVHRTEVQHIQENVIEHTKQTKVIPENFISNIALITVHQYDSQYTKSIENLSLSEAIRQMNDVKYTAFSEMGEQISTLRAAEIEQGNDKWAYSLDFDLDYNTVRIYTSTDDYINIGIEEALSVVSNHSEEEIISELKKVAEKEEKQADAPDYPTSPEESKKRTYEIYQIPSGERYRDIRFTRYELLELMGQLPDRLNYEKVYSGNLDDIEQNDKLDGIFVKFNNNRPEDYKGRSLSVSDVVVIEDENGKTAHFIDDIGFKDITDIFCEHERKEQSVEQLNINDYESIRLVSRSEWDDHTLSDNENPAYEEISVSYTPDENGFFTKYAYNTTNSNLIDVWDEETNVSGDELLEDIANHLKNMEQDKSNRSYHIEITDYDGHSRKLDSNNFSFVMEEKQPEIAASDIELERFISSMGYSIDEMDMAFEAENSRTDYGIKTEPAMKKSGNDVEVGDRFLYNDREYTVISDKGIYPDDVAVSYEEKTGSISYVTTQNVNRYKLADNGVFIGNSEKKIENSPVGNYDEELKKAAEYLKAYNEREFAISSDNEPFTADNLNHIGLGYTELGDNADYSFEVEADLEKYEVRYFLDEKLVKTDKYNSLKEMNEQELSNLEFDYFVSEGNEMLDKMLESGEMIILDVKKTEIQKITNEKNSYMIVDDVRHAINELYNGTAAGAYDWENYHSAFMSVLNANVHNDISLPLYKSAAEKILLAAQTDPEMITGNEYKNALSCLDMVLKNGQMLENPKEQEIEQFSFFGVKNHYVSMDEIPIEGANLKEQLTAAIQNINGEYNEAVKLSERENASHLDTVPCPPDAPKYGYVISDDTLYYHEAGDTMELVNDEKNIERIKAMTQLRDGVHELLDLQINNYNGENEVKISDAQNKLSKDYDNFVEHFGRIGQAENKRAFANDNSYHLIKSLEKTDNSGNFVSKADIFSKKTINPQIVVDHCNNAQDALILSLSEKMRVDMDYMSRLTDKSENELIAELGDKVYQNPQKNMRWESADEYLTGNIRTKLAAAEEAGLERNAEALRAVMPQRIEAADISVKLGSAWIDPEYIRQFIIDTLKPDFQTQNSIEVIYSEATDNWKIEGFQHSYGNTLATETFGTSDMNAYEIIEASLNMKKAQIKERVKDENGFEVRDDKGKYILAVNQDKTMVVQSKQEELKRKFQDWIFADPERRETLTNIYNEKFNSVRLREYDGSHLNFVGMNSAITLKPHQKNAVARSLYSNGNTLIAHEVGAGKTFEMVAIAMEGKRLGLHSKPLITAPNALTKQWGEAFRTLYSNSNVLVATEKDFKPENRRDLFAKIATGDWDAVIIGHSQFDMIHLSRERELDALYSEVDKLEAALDEISATSNKGSYSVKQVERAIKSYTDKIQKLLEKTPKEDMLCFEQLGIDKIFVDESQAYKNLDTPTKMQNVSGIGSGGSGRSMQLLMKCRYLDEVTGGKGVIFASGTPISNSMSEMYTLMRYLQADKLRELGINSFDRWASIFGETTTSMELSPEANGKYQMKTRFAKFQNLPELMNIFKECADIKTAATLNLDRPDFEMHNINVPATKMQSKMIKDLGERAKLIRAGAVEPTEDNMCKLTVDGRKIGLDQRCMNPLLPDDPNSKVNVCINNVFDIWKQTAEKKSTQLIFCDLATPQAAVNENTYTLYRKDTKDEYAPVYSAKLGQKDTADKIFKKLTSSKPPKNFKAGGVFDEDIIMIHTVDYDTMTASNSAVIALSGKISEIPEETWSKLHHSPTEAFESERKFCVYDDIKQKLVAKGVPEKEIAFIHDADTTEEKQKLFAKMNKGEIRVMIGSTQKCGAGMNAQERMIALHDLDAPMRPSEVEQFIRNIEKHIEQAVIYRATLHSYRCRVA